MIRERIRNAKGQLTDIQYTILEQPKPPQPGQGKPKQENPVLDSPVLGTPKQEEPEQGNPAQLNTKKSSNQGLNTDLSNTEVSNPIQSNPYEDELQAADGMGTDTRSSREIYREIILENIEYRHLVQNNQIDRERLDIYSLQDYYRSIFIRDYYVEMDFKDNSVETKAFYLPER